MCAQVDSRVPTALLLRNFILFTNKIMRIVIETIFAAHLRDKQIKIEASRSTSCDSIIRVVVQMRSNIHISFWFRQICMVFVGLVIEMFILTNKISYYFISLHTLFHESLIDFVKYFWQF